MKEKFKRLISIFIMMLMVLGSVVTNFGAASVFAAGPAESYKRYKINKKDASGAQVPLIYVESLKGGKAESVYCFNLRYAFPPTQGPNVSYPTYNKVGASAEKMFELAESKKL